MTDDKDKQKDVVVNLFKDKREKVIQKSEGYETTVDATKPHQFKHFNELVLENIETTKKDAEDFKATGIISIIMDDQGPIADYFAGSINLNSAYVLMDQLKNVILDKIEEAQEGKE